MPEKIGFSSKINRDFSKDEWKKERFSILKKYSWLIPAFIIIGGCAILLFDFALAMTIVLVATNLLITILMRIFRDNVKIIGELQIGDDFLRIKEEKRTTDFNINELSNIKIYFNGCKEITDYNRNSTAFWKMNNISFTKDDKEFFYRFEIKTGKQHDDLKKVIQSWYNAQINFKEYSLNQRSFLFKNNQTYKEIQEIKSKYNVEWV